MLNCYDSSVVTKYRGYLLQTLNEKEVYDWLYAINPLLAGRIRFVDKCASGVNKFTTFDSSFQIPLGPTKHRHLRLTDKNHHMHDRHDRSKIHQPTEDLQSEQMRFADDGVCVVILNYSPCPPRPTLKTLNMVQ